MNQNTLTPQDYIEIIIQRKWVLIFTILVGTLISITYSYSLPLIYRSSTLIPVVHHSDYDARSFRCYTFPKTGGTYGSKVSCEPD